MIIKKLLELASIFKRFFHLENKSIITKTKKEPINQINKKTKTQNTKIIFL